MSTHDADTVQDGAVTVSDTHEQCELPEPFWPEVVSAMRERGASLARTACGCVVAFTGGLPVVYPCAQHGGAGHGPCGACGAALTRERPMSQHIHFGWRAR